MQLALISDKAAGCSVARFIISMKDSSIVGVHSIFVVSGLNR